MAEDFIGLVWDPSALLGLSQEIGLDHEVAEIGKEIAAGARAIAPRGRGKNGHGADTIRSEELLLAGETVARISWDQLHAYMRFPDLGTKYQPGQHFMERALDHYARP
jgi:HK97 gp10 family phage protein